MISSISDTSNKFGTSHSPEYDTEAAVRFKSVSVGQELVVDQIQTSQLDRTLHQSFYPLQHRCRKLLSLPVVAVLIGVLVALLVFGFYSPSTRSIVTTASHVTIRNSYGQALLRFVKNAHQSRVTRAGMVFEQKVLDTSSLSGDADNAGGRQLLQTQSKGKYLRGYAEFGAQKTMKKRMRKYKNRPPKDPRDKIARKLRNRFPGWHPYDLSVLGEKLYWNLNMDAITSFFSFCDEFPVLVGMMHGVPTLVLNLFSWRDTLGHADFTILFISFPAFVVVLCFLLRYGPWSVLLRFLRFLSLLSRKKGS